MLIRCAECNTVFEDSQTVCPNCGKEIVVESNDQHTTIECRNWWTNYGSLIIVPVGLLLLITAITLLVMGIYFICEANPVNQLLNIGVTLTIVGAVCFALSIISFIVINNLQRKYGLKKSKPNKREQEEYEQLIRDFINSNK